MEVTLLISSQITSPEHLCAQFSFYMRKVKNIDDLYRIPSPKTCPLCKREIIDDSETHHLIPRLKGGNKGPTVELHRICHSKIHSIFTERMLQIKFNTIEVLLENDEIQKFVKWVANKPSNFFDGSKENNKRIFK